MTDVDDKQRALDHLNLQAVACVFSGADDPHDFDLLLKAFVTMKRAHGAQKDHAGAPYWLHPCRVALNTMRRGGSIHERVVALLHDVIEDTKVTAGDLRALGFPEPIVEACIAISRRDDDQRDEYYRRVVGDTLADPVKDDDVDDNSNPLRVALLAATKPAKAARLVGKYSGTRAELVALRAARDNAADASGALARV